MKKVTIVAMLVALLVVFVSNVSHAGEEKKIKIGFIYIGPIGDTGWNYAHEASRIKLVKENPEIETIAVASVSPEDAKNVIENMIDQGAEAIFATSWDFGPAVKTLANKYPNIHFFHCSGLSSSSNITSYFGRMYETIYLSGALAAMMSKNNHIGFLGPKIVTETFRHLNAFTLGAKKIKPEIVVEVAWTGDWYAPQKASQLVRGFAKKGVDVYFNRTDSAAALQIAIDEGIYAIGFNSDLSKFAPRNILTSAVWDWNIFYDHFLPEVKKGTLKATDIWWGLDRNAVRLTPFSKAVPTHVARKIKELETALRKGKLSVFKGPIYDNSGRMMVKSGTSPNDEELRNMNWPLYGIHANLPEPEAELSKAEE